jgi:hypothetical protein
MTVFLLSPLATVEPIPVQIFVDDLRACRAAAHGE